MEFKLGKHRVRSGDVISSELATADPEVILTPVPVGTREFRSIIFSGPAGIYYAVYDVAGTDHRYVSEMTSDPEKEWYRYPAEPGVYRMRVYSHPEALAFRPARDGSLTDAQVNQTRRLIETRATLVETIVFIVVDRPDIETRFCRCIIKVARNSPNVNPFAVCQHSVKPGGQVKCGRELAGLVRDPEIPLDFIVAYMKVYGVEIPPGVSRTRANLLWLIDQKKTAY